MLKRICLGNYVENGIYSMLATNVLTTASTVSANTIASASVVIMQSMRESVNKPKLNLMLLLKHIKKEAASIQLAEL